MTFTSLASSSGGNCYVVADGVSAILLECGIPFRQIQRGLDFQVGGLSACLISHEHSDHAKCYDKLAKNGVEVLASEGTIDALTEHDGKPPLITPIAAGEQFQTGSFLVLPFETFHNAREPLGFLIYSLADGERLVFATDTANLAYRFQNVSILALEANYDAEIAARDLAYWQGRATDKVYAGLCKRQYRVERSHMEIDRLCAYLRTLDLFQCRKIYLLHLSDGHSDEAEFAYKVRRAVPAHVAVEVCGR